MNEPPTTRSKEAPSSEMKVPHKAGPICKIDGCGASLAHAKKLNVRCRMCEDHMSALEVVVDGSLGRFCQQCSRVEPLLNFDGKRRSCREGLARIMERRKERISALKASSQPNPFDLEVFPPGHAVTTSNSGIPRTDSLLRDEELSRNLSAPLPINNGLKRASTSFSSDHMEEAANKMTRRISVTIRGRGAPASLTVDGSRNDSLPPTEQSFLAAASAAVAELKQHGNAEESRGSTANHENGGERLVVPNPFSGANQPISLSIRARPARPLAATPAPKSEQASADHSQATGEPATPCSRQAKTSLDFVRPHSPPPPTAGLARASTAGPLLQTASSLEEVLLDGSLSPSDRACALECSHVHEGDRPHLSGAGPSQAGATPVAVSGSLFRSCSEGSQMLQKDGGQAPGLSLHSMLQRAAAASRADAAQRRARFSDARPAVRPGPNTNDQADFGPP
mmetsp:Transcript_36960/g.93328  ORF Transcript_36960/g.93328 Transcript_36960/m.93328 type:complete len:453 (-) Transcript_36960:327-1685(-)